MRYSLPCLATLAAVFFMLAAALHPAFGADIRPEVNALGTPGYTALKEAIGALAATGDPAVPELLQALGQGELYVRVADSAVFKVTDTDDGYNLVDPLTGEDAGPAAADEVSKITVNNSVRETISAALGLMTLMSPDPQKRLAAAGDVYKSQDPKQIPLLDTAIAKETDKSVAAALQLARAAAVLRSDMSDADKLAAVEIVSQRDDQDAISLLSSFVASAPDGAAKTAAASAITTIQGTLQLWSGVQNVWYGISLGSVLLLAAIGLAITFGVMGIINMAHGEMVMLGAYTTFVVQEVIRSHYPGLFDWSLAIALPLAFLVSGGVGVLIERSVIRFLYGRPLETLLATWGISLILQQAVRTWFGPNNREVGNPSWMSGTFDLGHLAITYNRMWIVVFALGVFAVLMLVLKRTPFGLQTRAVTQNRPMASSMGIRTPYVDALTFGLGSGIAGIAGVALSQIDNVSPNLGQNYIIDSFMVVVFGGVGNLWGTLVGAFTLGIANKFLEPYAGAVLAKILVLVFIILFIQKRPRGLFALKGRSVEA
ncbi:urea ABC transporter permease subunit UrtB [Mesorhizobium sp. BR1-1-16]|uniref:urea ABC transporter permease subunit UrtB n=1 Tax=Mesorhizobium sp. BR1-1-16 TaxID=2876653 RepID=UPI001CCADE62|nr:urea ABC transporter permease subunit UrtB [Mesorhizobium sp. BR1-1-16]MBZ9936072.1 urea ABC transporter permease subunit UrtB [Mesorhizobium sp. BR1-1-16]